MILKLGKFLDESGSGLSNNKLMQVEYTTFSVSFQLLAIFNSVSYYSCTIRDPDCNQLVTFYNQNVRHVRPVSLLVFFFFFYTGGNLKEPGITSGRSMCVKGAGNREWLCKWTGGVLKLFRARKARVSLWASNGETNFLCITAPPRRRSW